MELRPERLLEAAETEENSVPLARFRALAAELGIFLHIGSLAIKLDQTRIANRSYLIEPDGGVAARYDKLHLFDVDLAGGESYRESQNVRPGTGAVLADLPFGRLGLSICYDLRFPQLYRALAIAGADLPLVVTLVALLLSLSVVSWWLSRGAAPPVAHDPVSVVIADFQNGTSDADLRSRARADAAARSGRRRIHQRLRSQPARQTLGEAARDGSTRPPRASWR